MNLPLGLGKVITNSLSHSLQGSPYTNSCFPFIHVQCLQDNKTLKCKYMFTGQLLLAKGEIDNAFQAFTIGLGNSDNVPALLGQVLTNNDFLFCYVANDL